MRGPRSRRNIENANFQRQTQAISILAIGTVIMGGALFQVDISLDNLLTTSQLLARIQASLVLSTGMFYALAVIGTTNILTQTLPLTGHHVKQHLMKPLLMEILN